jgi:hypothetical protein
MNSPQRFHYQSSATVHQKAARRPPPICGSIQAGSPILVGVTTQCGTNEVVLSENRCYLSIPASEDVKHGLPSKY